MYYRQTRWFKAICQFVLLTFTFSVIHPANFGIRTEDIRIGFDFSFLSFASDAWAETLDELDPAIGVVAVPSVPSTTAITGSQITVRYYVFNLTPRTLDNAVLQTTFASGITIVKDTPAGDTAADTSVWSLGKLSPLDTAVVTVELKLPPSIPVDLDGGAIVHGSLNGRAVKAPGKAVTLRTDSVDPALLSSVPGADLTDTYVLALASRLKSDPTKIFEYVRDHIGFESYKGALRGARGTIWSEAGNALDRASLLVALYRASGFPARYVRGTLPVADRKRLIKSMFHSVEGTVGFVQSDHVVSDPENDPGLLAEVGDHFWVEVDTGSGFTAVDPSFPDSVIGSVTGTPSGPALIATPEELHHRLTFRLNTEFYSQASALFGLGLGLSPTPVLDQSFRAVDVAGKPLAIGANSASNAIPSPVFSYQAFTYTPFIQITDSDTTIDNDPGFEGVPFTETLTSFPLGSNVLTGLFLQIDTTAPDGSVKRAERTLIDRIGFDVRTNGGTPNADFTKPGITSGDVFLVNVVVGEQFKYLVESREEYLQTLQAKADQIQAELTALGSTPSTDPILTQRTSKSLVEAGIAGSQLTTQRFLRESDNMTSVLADTLLLASYTDSPRLIIASTRFDATDSQNPTLTFSLDLRQDMVRSIASPGQSTFVSFGFNQTRGMMQSQMEGRALIQSGEPGISAFSISQAAHTQGIQDAVVSATNPQDIDLLQISAEAKARISLAVADGWFVQVPERMVDFNGKQVIGWFQMRPDTGETIGVLEDGTHGFVQTVASYAVFLVLGIPIAFGLGAVFGAISAVFINGAFLLREEAGNLALAEKFYLEQKLGANPDASNIDWAWLTGKAAWELVLSAFPVLGLQFYNFNVHWLAAGAIGIAFSAGFWIGLFTVLRACYRNLSPGIDPPILPYKTAELPSIYNSPSASIELPLPANIGGSALSVNRTAEYVRVSGGLTSTWAPAGSVTFPAQSLSAASAIVKDSTNNTVASGALTGTLDAGANIELSSAGQVSVNGTGSVTFYGSQSGNIGSATWSALNGSASGGTVTKVVAAHLTVGGTALPVGDYTIEATALTFSGSGASGAPNFISSAQFAISGGALEVGSGAGSVTVDGAPVLSEKGVGASPFTGTVNLISSAGSYSVTANGTFGKLAISSSSPDLYNITQNDSVEIAPAAFISAAGDYRFEVVAPPGWTVSFAPDGKLTVQPASGLQSGSFDVHLSIRSKADSSLVAEEAFTFNIGATAPSLVLQVTKDTFNTMQIEGVEVPTTFQASVRNTGPANDTFAVSFENVPAGFEGVVSEPALQIDAAQRRYTGLYLKPVGPLPAVGTVIDFSIRAQSQSNGAIFQVVPFSYVVPAIHGVKVSAAPESFSVTPGETATTEITFEAIGNVPEVVALQEYPQPGLTAAGLPAQVALVPGSPESFTVLLTPDPALPLGTNKAYFFTGTYGELPFKGSAVIEVRISAPGSDAAKDAASTATILGYTGIGQTLNSLGGSLVAIFLNNLDPIAQSQIIADLNSLMSQLDDPFFADLVDDLQSVRDGIAAGDPAAINAALGLLPGLLEQLEEYLKLLKKHNFKLLLQPNSQVTSAGQTVSYQLYVTNVGTDTTTIDFSFGALPGNVTSSFTNSSVTLAPGATSAGFVTAQLTQNGSSIIPFEFEVVGTVTSSPTAVLSKRTKGAMTVRDEAVQVTSVKVSPPFVQPGQSTFILAQTLSLINQERPAKIYYEVLNDSNAVVATSTTADIVLSPEEFSKFHNLPQLDTTGYPLGNYKVRVRLTEANGTLIPGAENQTNLLVGSPVEASLTIDPEQLAPGNGSVNALLDVRSDFGLASGLQLLGQTSAFNAQGGNFVIKNDRVYIPGGNAGNFGAIVDISDPTNPTPVGTFNAGSALRNGSFGGFALSGAAQDKLVVGGGPGSITGGPNLDTDIGVFSLANPVAPSILTTTPGSAVQRQFFCGILGRNDDVVFPFTCGFRYFLGSNDIFHHWGSVHSFSVANPATPQFLNDFYHDTLVDNVNPPITIQGFGPGFSAFAAIVSNNTLYHFGTSGSQNTPGDGSGVVKVFNISNPADPVLDHTLSIPGTGIILSGTQDGNTMLLVGATGSLGDFVGDFAIQGDLVLTLLDVSTPLNPTIIRQQSFPEVRPNYVTRGAVIGGGKWVIAEHMIFKATNTTVFGIVDTSQPGEIGFTPVPAYPGADQLTFQVYEGNLVIVAPPPAGVLIYSLTNTNQADISARVRVPKGTGVSVVPGSYNVQPNEIIPGATFDTLVWDNSNFPLPYLPFHKQFTFSLNIQNLDGVEAREVLNGGTIDFVKSGTPGKVELDSQFVSSGDVIDVDPFSRTAAPGDFAEYSVFLRNPGKETLTLTPSVLGIDESWVEFTPPQVTLQQGASYEVIMRVGPDSGSILGTRSFKATALRNGETIGAASAEIVVAGDPIVPSDKSTGIEVQLTPSTGIAGKTNPARYSVKVTNTGRQPEEVLVFENAPGFSATFDKNVITLLPGRSNSFTYQMDLLPLPGTAAGLYPFSVRALVLPTGEVFDTASGTVTVVNKGVAVNFQQPSVVPGTTVSLQVINSGTAVDTFNLNLAGPGAPFSTLSTQSVTLNPGSATSVDVAVGRFDFVSAGNLPLVAVATSASNGGIRAKAETQIVIPTVDGLTAKFIPSTRQLGSPGATTLYLEIQNTSNLPWDFTAQIISATGQVVGQLVDQSGAEGQSIPILRLPALGKGTFLVKAAKGTLGTGTLTVRIGQIVPDDGGDVQLLVEGPQLLQLPPVPKFVDATATIIVGNVQDNCPEDPAKTDPGACGCGVADTDSDGDQVPNCLDGCSSNAAKTSPGICGCAVADVDANGNGTVDCLEPPPCTGSCTSGNPLLDEDGDGVTNCVEAQEQTDACDKGSFVPRLAPSACAGANGFLKQVNIATILNHLNIPLHVAAEYRDLGGVLRGAVEFDLGPKLKRDLIVDDMGLADDTYGTVCVFTNARTEGAWSGGITLYKPRIDGRPDLGLSKAQAFDFALYYPFTNPQKGSSTISLNTNTIGTDGLGTVANWIRITDAVPGDGKGLAGRVDYFNIAGDKVDTDEVSIPDGGRFDYSGHDALGLAQVGLGQFVPADPTAEYYIEGTRYFYEGTGATSANFYTAFALPNRPLTGAQLTGRASIKSGELSVIEIVNGAPSPIVAQLNLFDEIGNLANGSDIFLPQKGSVHRILGGNGIATGSVVSAQVSASAKESLGSVTVTYVFDAKGGLELAYAPPFGTSAGQVQITEFNSFIGHKNELELINSTSQAMTVQVTIINYDQAPLGTQEVKIGPKSTQRVVLAVPEDTYGTVIVDAGGQVGLLVRNDVVSPLEYVLPFVGR